MGGSINSSQILESPADDLIVMAPAGNLQACRQDGTPLWSHRYRSSPSLIGLYDIEGNGRQEILATTSDVASATLDLFDAASGNLLWSSPIEPGGAGAVKMFDLDGDGKLELIWAPAASSVVRAYTFADGLATPRLLWKRTLWSYSSDPYSYSPIAIRDVNGDGSPDIVMVGGRGSVTLWILDGRSGDVLSREDYLNTDPSIWTESGGWGQLVMVRDVDHDGEPEIIVIGSYASTSAYMFQGAMVIDPLWPYTPVVLNTRPIGLRYVTGSIQDFDGDGKDDILVSYFDSIQGVHVLELLDAKTLTVKRQLAGYRLEAVVTGIDRRPRIVASTGITTEQGSSTGVFKVLRLSDQGFDPAAWSIYADSMLTNYAHDRRPDSSNEGAEPVVVDANHDGTGDVVFARGAARTFFAVDIETGKTLATHSFPAGEVPGAVISSSADSGNLLVGLSNGDVVALDSTLVGRTIARVGGFFELNGGNGHNNELAVVADLDGDGINEIYATASNQDLMRIDIGRTAPRSQLFHRGIGNQEPVMAGTSMLLRSCDPVDATAICDADAHGHLSSRSTQFSQSSIMPVAVNVGKNLNTGAPIVFGSGSLLFPMPVYALDPASGQLLWESTEGSYWDASLAVWDWNHDGVPDVVTNYNTSKATILNGANGDVLCESITAPQYGNLGYVDYNGVPVLVDDDNDGTAEILIGEDDAHMMLLEPCTASSPTTIRWAVDQASIDDERGSMPALAPVGDSVIIGVGTKRGVLVARDARTGSTIWERALLNGAVVDSATTLNPLSSVIAVDVDGRDGYDFVVGGAGGWLYAINAATGNLVWSIDLGYAVGDPIAADVDGDGASEILVPTAEGVLYVIDGALPRRRAY